MGNYRVSRAEIEGSVEVIILWNNQLIFQVIGDNLKAKPVGLKQGTYCSGQIRLMFHPIFVTVRQI